MDSTGKPLRATVQRQDRSRSANSGWLGSLKLDAKRSGYQELIRWAAEFGSNPVFAVE